MIKALQQQLPLLSLNGLRDFAAKQSKYLDEVKRLISGAQSEIAKIDKDAQAFMTGGTKRINNLELRINSSADAAVQVQVADKKAKVRQGLDSQLSPLFKKMLAAKEVAKEYATRHWTKPQVLNRATTGNGGTEGIQRRAAYAVIFEKIGKAQLFDFGQLAIDTGDAVLADSVYRAVMTRGREDRPFQPAEFISIMPNAEYEEATAILQSVLDTADSAGLAIATFEGNSGKVSLNRIALGLAGQGEKIADGSDDPFDEAGGIREDAIVRMGARVSGQRS